MSIAAARYVAMLTGFVNRVHNFVDRALGLGLGLDRVAEEGEDDEDAEEDEQGEVEDHGITAG